MWGLGDWCVGCCQNDAYGREDCERVGYRRIIDNERIAKNRGESFLEHNADNVADDVDLIVYTPAVDFENPELKNGKN